MALINCIECSKEISDMAKTCPHCGVGLSIKPQKEAGKGVKIVIGLIVFFVLANFLLKGPETQNDASYIERNKELIKNRLKDPDSAEFQNVFVSNKMGAPIVCGQVNAKNGFGGYTGFQRFISGGNIQVTETDMAADEMNKSWQEICGSS